MLRFVSFFSQENGKIPRGKRIFLFCDNTQLKNLACTQTRALYTRAHTHYLSQIDRYKKNATHISECCACGYCHVGLRDLFFQCCCFSFVLFCDVQKMRDVYASLIHTSRTVLRANETTAWNAQHRRSTNRNNKTEIRREESEKYRRKKQSSRVKDVRDSFCIFRLRFVFATLLWLLHTCDICRQLPMFHIFRHALSLTLQSHSDEFSCLSSCLPPFVQRIAIFGYSLHASFCVLNQEYLYVVSTIHSILGFGRSKQRKTNNMVYRSK